jgi:hypothetical protein
LPPWDGKDPPISARAGLQRLARQAETMGYLISLSAMEVGIQSHQ